MREYPITEDQPIAEHFRRRAALAQHIANTLINHLSPTTEPVALHSKLIPIPLKNIQAENYESPIAVAAIDSGTISSPANYPFRYLFIATRVFAHPLKDTFPEELNQALKDLNTNQIVAEPTAAEYQDRELGYSRALAELLAAAQSARLLREKGYHPIIFMDGQVLQGNWNVNNLPPSVQEQLEKCIQDIANAHAILIGYIDNAASNTLVNAFRAIIQGDLIPYPELLTTIRDRDIIYQLTPPNHSSPAFTIHSPNTAWLAEYNFALQFAYLVLQPPLASTPIFVRLEWLAPIHELSSFYLNSPILPITLTQIAMRGNYPFALAAAHEQAYIDHAIGERITKSLNIALAQYLYYPLADQAKVNMKITTAAARSRNNPIYP